MTIAGTATGAEARRFRGRADEHRRQANEDEQRAGRYEIAERTEAETARVLAPLAGIGYHLLADRRWPGSRHAQVDMTVVGKQVLLAHVRGRLLADGPASMSEAERERRKLDRRELYVGMTRARDGLWVGTNAH